jgi:hypothetical protein
MRLAGRVKSAHHPDPFRFNALQQLGEARQAVQPPLDGLFRQAAVFQARPQLHFFRQGLHRAHFPVLDFGDDEVKRVAAEVDGCQQAAVGEGFLVF